jgi:hypothetical protein
VRGLLQPNRQQFSEHREGGTSHPGEVAVTGANGVPIDDPASFLGPFSYPVNCSDFQGDPTDAIEQAASGSSGLQYNGDGYWQFNWKTPKDDANNLSDDVHLVQ